MVVRCGDEWPTLTGSCRKAEMDACEMGDEYRTGWRAGREWNQSPRRQQLTRLAVVELTKTRWYWIADEFCAKDRPRARLHIRLSLATWIQSPRLSSSTNYSLSTDRISVCSSKGGTAVRSSVILLFLSTSYYTPASLFPSLVSTIQNLSIVQYERIVSVYPEPVPWK